MTFKVAFIGLGRMGSGMAARVIAAGHDVSVFNRDVAKASALRGARVCTSAREAAMGADAIMTMTASDDSSRAVWTGPDGVLSAQVTRGALAIECSTVSHDWAIALAREARSRGLRYIDAPVTGLPPAAAAGELTLLVGAEPEDLEAARPLLAAVSNRVVHFGPVGTGTAYKLMINLMGAVQIAAAAEGMALAERAGLDLKQVADAIATGQAASPQVVRNSRHMAENDHDKTIVFTPVLRLKDVDYALQFARQLGIGVPFGEVARNAFRRAAELGHAHRNESVVVEAARAQLPV